MEEHDIKTFIETILDPTFVDSFYGAVLEAGTLIVAVYESSGPPKKVTLTHIFPFMTVFDIKLAIYNAYKRDDRAHPDFVFLGRPKFGTKLETTDFTWSFSATPTEPVLLLNPTATASGLALDSRFINSTGGRRDIRRTDMERVTIEEKFLQRNAPVPVLNAYFYSALEAMIPGERPLSEQDWNGRLYPFFPTLSIANHTITTEQRAQAKKLADNFVIRRIFFSRLEDILNSGQPIVSVTLSAIRYLRLTYTKPTVIPGIEVLFYEVPVNERRPYMRLMPVENSPISKVHMVKDSNVPNLEDPWLLNTWSQEKSPTPDRDFAMVKVLLRKASGSTIPLYATIRLFDDATADITVEPPKPMKKLDPVTDLSSLGEGLADALTGFPYLRELPRLKNGNFIFAVNMKDVLDIPYTHATFRKRLPIMSAIFQEIPSIEGDAPMITLRYKLVANFNREDRIQTFITQLLTINPVRNEIDFAARVDEIAKEFQISNSAAREQIAKKLERAGEIVLTNPETKDYAAFNNPGVDIAIFAKHPVYFFHVFRADSYETIQRIITFLSILFSRPDSDFKVTEEDMAKYGAGEKESVKRADNSKEDEEAGPEEENVPDTTTGSEEENQFENVPDTTTIEAGPESYGDFDMSEFAADNQGPSLEEAEKEAEKEAEEERQRTDTVTVGPVKGAIKKAADAKAPTKGVEKYFSDKLKDADRALFDFHKTHPDLTKYVTQCASNLMRQPAVLSPDQFEQMNDEYKTELDNGSIRFFVFPLEKDAKKDKYDADPAKMEYYTLMRYGSALTNQNYYMCCKFFCIRDEMMVREVELLGTKLRPKHYVKQADGTIRTTKERGTCPMCEGKVIQNRRFPGANETIIERNVKSGTDNGRHLYIRFLTKTNHPDGLYLPCCFLQDQPLRIGDAQFPEPSEEARAARFPAPEGAEDAPVLTDETVQKITISYEETILTARTASIVGAEKMPLDPAIKKIKKVRRDKATGAFLEAGESGKITEIVPPQIGLLPVQVNTYFAQNPIDLVSRTFNPQKLRPESKGFLRVGVENRGAARADSFLAAVAPFFRYNSVDDFKDALYDIIQPRLFMGLNFGNLLLELYDPMWIPRYLSRTGKPPSNQELRIWAFSDLKINKMTTSNEELVRRAFLSYDKFCWWLSSEKTVKEYRHFAHFLSLPGIMNIGVRKYASSDTTIREFRRPGILFIVLDILESGELKVRCPPYPISDEIFKRSDVGFLLRHYTGVWEPIFYYNNIISLDDGLNQAMLTFPLGQKTSWPEIVEKRLNEFRTQCSMATGGLGIYTSSRGLNSRRVVPLLRVKGVLSKYEDISIQGLLRDSYNHVAAIIYKGDKGGLVAVPVIEDGISYSFHQDVTERMTDDTRPGLTLVVDVKVVFDWDDFKPAPMNQVIEFYKKYVEPHFPDLYTVKKAIKSNSTGKIEAIQLKNGLYIPVSPPDDTSRMPPSIPVASIDEMEWTINKQIVVGSTISLEELHGTAELNTKELNETFEHLRLTFSNWLNSKEDGGNFRKELEETLSDANLPLYERRKRVEIMIGSTVEGWLSEADEDAPRQPSLLRVDCLLRPKEECGGSCSWSEGGSKCLIHVRKGTEGEGSASAGHILLLRLIEELLRFSNRRREIFEQRVSQLAILDTAVRQGEQYIVPEKSVAWTELLRMEWLTKSGETPQYLEEMRQEPTEAQQKPLAPATEVTALPATLVTLFGPDDPKTARLRIYPSPTGSFESFLSLFNTSGTEVGMGAEDSELSDDVLTKLVKKAKLPIVQYDLREDPPKITGKQLARDSDSGYAIFVIAPDKRPSMVVTDTEAPALLRRSELPAAFVEFLTKSGAIKRIFVRSRA